MRLSELLSSEDKWTKGGRIGETTRLKMIILNKIKGSVAHFNDHATFQQIQEVIKDVV
jgi:hypothetical protein